MANYGENYDYGMSPTYKDEGQSGRLLVSKVEDTGSLTSKSFPVLDVIPSSYKFGYTGLFFSPKKYRWDFGDGTGSYDPTPEHTYNTHGHHDVQLFIMDNYNEWHRVADIYTHFITLGKLNFEGSPLKGDRPLEVTFEDSSFSPTGCYYTGMQWDFGDTYGSTGLNPEPHTYLDYGSYTVGINVLLNRL